MSIPVGIGSATEEGSEKAREVRVLRPDEGDIVRLLGDLYLTKGRAVDTQGRYSFFEARNNPGSGVPLHYHTEDEESFYVVDGKYEFRAGDQSVIALPGDYLFVPRPTPHAFFNIGHTVGRVVIVLSPGGIHERFFHEVGETIDDLDNPPAAAPLDPQRFNAALDRAGIVMVGEDVPGAKDGQDGSPI